MTCVMVGPGSGQLIGSGTGSDRIRIHNTASETNKITCWNLKTVSLKGQKSGAVLSLEVLANYFRTSCNNPPSKSYRTNLKMASLLYWHCCRLVESCSDPLACHFSLSRLQRQLFNESDPGMKPVFIYWRIASWTESGHVLTHQKIRCGC